MTFTLYIAKKANTALLKLSDDEYTWCSGALQSLMANPFPGSDGDKEKLKGQQNHYRLHIGRSYTAIYKIDKIKKRVCIIFFGDIGAAHKEY